MCLRFPGGQWVSPLLFSLKLRELDTLERFRVIQESLDWVPVLLVLSRPWTGDEEERLRRSLLDGLPPGVRVDIEGVEGIDDTPGTKFRPIISKLPQA